MPDSNASDWSDLDLLTVSEAVGRLDAEIADLRGRLGVMAEGVEREAVEKRLQLLGRARENAVAGPKIRRRPT
ncbi:MAG TPA: hypothetical protein VL595_01420 [Pseudonocardia sp.]|jgi:hypothetical protein|nr:hypothetical protein [Pseudonocardia sp.]